MISHILRQLPPFKGKARLARLLLRNRGVSEKVQLVTGDYGLKYFVPNTNESIGFFLLINGIYEKDVSDYIIRTAPVNALFIDIGINIGSISLPVAKRRPDCKIIGVEAASEVFECLQRNIAINNGLNITPINKAVSDKDGELVSFYSPEEQFGKGSMSPVFTEDGKMIETITLDQLVKDHNCSKVDIIKIDVEGYEYKVFKGGKGLLSPDKAPDIIFEFVDWAEDLAQGMQIGDSQRLIKEYGYTLYNFDKIKDGPIETILHGSMNILASKRPFTDLV
jgi:FkbM family methyltransferase